MKEMTVQQIAGMLKEQQLELNELHKIFHDDPRKGVRNAIKKHIKERMNEEQERERLKRLLTYEERAISRGYTMIAGVDEVGRGPLAGPVMAAAVILPSGLMIPGLNDSKQLNEIKREHLFEQILDKAVAVGVGIVEASVIDIINIHQASLAAMRNAVFHLNPAPGYIMVDGAFPVNGLNFPQEVIKKGDSLSLSIAAASVIAKVIRDRFMKQLDVIYPGYDLGGHKGYGTKKHFEAINSLGLSPVHRRSFCSALHKEIV